METTLDYKKKATTNSPRSVLKRNNIVEEGVLGLGVKREKESIDLRAQKMMKDRMELFAISIVVKLVPPMVKEIK
jgi:hypothetical protein